MAVRMAMQRRRLASGVLSSWLFTFGWLAGAHAQPRPGEAGPPSNAAAPPSAGPSGAAPSASPSPPATPGPATPAHAAPAPAAPAAPPASIPPQYLAPGQAPQPAGPYSGGSAPDASRHAAPPQPDPGYPQQGPVYPQPYPAPAPGPYGTYPPPPNYPYGAPYREQTEGEQPDEGARRHDGFFLRLKVGIGAGGTAYRERVREPDIADVKTRGLSGNFQLSIGGAVIENLIVHGDLVLSAMSLNKTVDGVEDSSYDKLSSSLFMLGGGATYYFMPTNLYLTLIVGVAHLAEERFVDAEDTESTHEFSSGGGVGMSLSVGKEWFVGKNAEWGLGAAITGAFATAPVRIGELTTRFRGNSITLDFSATFN